MKKEELERIYQMGGNINVYETTNVNRFDDKYWANNK